MKFRSPFLPPRSVDGTLLPAALSALLVAAGLLQLLWTGAPELPDEGVGRVMPASEAALSLPRAIAPPVIMGRPLFSPTRTAGTQSVATGGDGPLGGASPVGMMSRGRAARLFLKLPDGSIQRLPVGGIYQGWRLVALTEDGAMFVQGQEKIKINYGSSATVTRTGTKSGEGDEEPQEE